MIEDRFYLAVGLRDDRLHVRAEEVHVRVPSHDGDGGARVVHARAREVARPTRRHAGEPVEVLRAEEREAANVGPTAGRHRAELDDRAVLLGSARVVVVVPLDHDLAGRGQLQTHVRTELDVAATDGPAADELGAFAERGAGDVPHHGAGRIARVTAEAQPVVEDLQVVELGAEARGERACGPRNVVVPLAVALARSDAELRRVRRRRLPVNTELVTSLTGTRDERLELRRIPGAHIWIGRPNDIPGRGRTSARAGVVARAAVGRLVPRASTTLRSPTTGARAAGSGSPTASARATGSGSPSASARTARTGDRA